MSFLECCAMLTGKQLPIYQWQQDNISEDSNLQNWYILLTTKIISTNSGMTPVIYVDKLH